MFLPATRTELRKLGWDRLDVILVTGDAYMDTPFSGVAVVGKFLLNKGFKVGVIAQPELGTHKEISRLGTPRLFWGVSAGCVDSMVANYTPARKRRKRDDFTPGGRNDRRPDRAAIAYTNLIRRYCKPAAPIVLGGVEASLRRLAHYDYWDDSMRRSILFDAKADILVYGMGERAVLELARRLESGREWKDIPGICYISGKPREGFLTLPSYEEVRKDKEKAADAFHLFYRNAVAGAARGLCQQQTERWVIHNPAGPPLSESEMDEIYGLAFERDLHPSHKGRGEVRALSTIRFSITTHRGCFAECNFCAIAVHQGRAVSSRSENSILREARIIAGLPDFKGYILDVGGPTANMYGMACNQAGGRCGKKRCVYPQTCSRLDASHKRQIDLLQKMRGISGIKKVFVASGIRYDLVLDDRQWGLQYLRAIVEHHVSGQMKVAPEHSEDTVLAAMGKPSVRKTLPAFKKLFDAFSRKAGKKQFLTYYLIAAHPGCGDKEMRSLREFASKKLKLYPEQIQIFTPTPSTYSTLMYCTGIDPFTGDRLFVEKDPARKERQKQILLGERAAPAKKPRR